MMSHAPLYWQVYERILSEAARNGIAADTALPSIKRLTKIHEVGEITVRRALSELKKEGLISSVRGGGVYFTEEAATRFRPDFKREDSPKSAVMDEDKSIDILGIPFARPLKKTDLTLSLIDYSPFQRKLWNALCERFHSTCPGIHIEPIFNDRVGTGDIIQIPGELMPSYIRNGTACALPAKAFPVESFPADALPFSKDGELFGLPVLITVPVTLVNRGLFDKLVKQPTTEDFDWNTYISLARKLADARKRGAISSEIFIAASIQRQFQHLTGVDAKTYDPITGRFNCSSPSVLRFLKDIASVGGYDGAVRPDPVHDQAGGSSKLFSSSRLIFHITTNLSVLNMFPEGLPEAIDLLPFPMSPKGGSFWCTNMLVARNDSVHTPEALEFLRFMCSEDARRIVTSQGFRHILGGRREWAPDPRLFDILQATMERSLPVTVIDEQSYSFIINVFSSVANQTRDGLLSPQKAAALLKNRYDEFISLNIS